MAGWIKVPLGAEVDLGPGDIVLDGDPAPSPKKGAQHPQFLAHVLWPNGWMDQDATWYEVSLSSGDIVLDGPTAASFRSMSHLSVVAKRSPISATAELSYSHYTGQSVLASTRSLELEEFVGANFYCLHAISDGTWCIQMKEKALGFSSAVVPALSSYHFPCNNSDTSDNVYGAVIVVRP